MVTINRAVKKGNKPSLISQLAHEVAKKYLLASNILQVSLNVRITQYFLFDKLLMTKSEDPLLFLIMLLNS